MDARIGFLQGFIRLFAKRDFTLTGQNINKPQRRPVLLFSQVVAKAANKDGYIEAPASLQLRRQDESQAVATRVSALLKHQGRLYWASANEVRCGEQVVQRVPKDHLITAFVLTGDRPGEAT